MEHFVIPAGTELQKCTLISTSCSRCGKIVALDYGLATEVNTDDCAKSLELKLPGPSVSDREKTTHLCGTCFEMFTEWTRRFINKEE